MTRPPVGALGSGEPAAAVGPTVVALTVWVGLPLVLGTARTLRREVS
ncbi:MAG: hypothetical protein H7Y15_19720 [Pseudonocardia sp.]|nr:hypothetical protein [Pseudonocardia sp.]